MYPSIHVIVCTHTCTGRAVYPFLTQRYHYHQGPPTAFPCRRDGGLCGWIRPSVCVVSVVCVVYVVLWVVRCCVVCGVLCMVCDVRCVACDAFWVFWVVYVVVF